MTVIYNGTLALDYYDENCTVPTSLPDSIHPAVDYVQAAIALIVTILGISMNGFVVFLVSRYRALHKMAFFLALQLIVTHLVFSCTLPPVIFATALLREWRLGTVMCQILGSIHDLVFTIRYLLTFVLTADRVVSVFCPFFYLRHGAKMAICNSAVMWIIGILRSLLSLKGVLNCIQYVPTFKMCAGAAYCSDICQIHTLFFSALLALFGVIIPFALYVALFSKAMMIKYQFRYLLPRQKQQVASPSIVSTQSSSSPKPLKSANNTEEGLHTNTNKIRVKTVESDVRHNHRATITFVILTAVIIGCALPPYVLYATQYVLAENASPIVTTLQMIVGRTLVYSLVAADPIIIMRNRDVREVVKSNLGTLKIFWSY